MTLQEIIMISLVLFVELIAWLIMHLLCEYKYMWCNKRCGQCGNWKCLYWARRKDRVYIKKLTEEIYLQYTWAVKLYASCGELDAERCAYDLVSRRLMDSNVKPKAESEA